MSFFSRLYIDQLYTAEAGAGFIYFLLPPGVAAPKKGIELADALSSKTLQGSFAFSTADPKLTAATAKPFVDAVLQAIRQAGAQRGMIWLPDPAKPVRNFVLGLNPDGTQTSGGLLAPLLIGLQFSVPGGMALKLAPNGTDLQFDGSQSGVSISFAGPSKPQGGQSSFGELSFAGPDRGIFRLSGRTFFFPRQTLHDTLCWGFQFLYPNPVGSLPPTLAVWMPLANGLLPNATDLIGFDVRIDPSDPYNAILPDRSAFIFTGRNRDNTKTVLNSFFRTIEGELVRLTPVPGPLAQVPTAGRLVINPGLTNASGRQQFQLAPQGDFSISADVSPAGAPIKLLCGLQGTEYVAIDPSVATDAKLLRFVSRQPAFAASYPFQTATPVQAPVDPNARVLDTTYTTSWASLTRPDAKPASVVGEYVAQPRGAALYGRDKLINAAHPSLLGGVDPAVQLSSSVTFPLPPYAGVVPGDGHTSLSGGLVEDFERQVLGPTRRRLIGQSPPAPRVRALAATASRNVTTPAGLLVTLDAQSAWSRLLLGQNLPPGSTDPKNLRRMAFCQPDAVLQEAFSTGQLFLVVANADHLGPASDALDCSGSAAFLNRMNVEDWLFAADIGTGNHYADYRNVMIVKGRKGALYDPDTPENSLVASPQKWTLRDTLGAPADLVPNPSPPPNEIVGRADPSELTALSYWLLNYFETAADQADSDYFDKFNTIATNPDWTGILILRLRIAELPKDLSGIVAGVTAPDLFNAHHLAFEISQVQNTGADIDLKGPSSIFGLIYYVDPDFTPPDANEPVQPVPPPDGVDYDFRLLTLKVLFENTAVSRFQSYAQITLNNLFQMPVASMGAGGNPYNTIVLKGSYQNNNGMPSYNLGSTSDNFFHFDNTFFNKIEIVGAQMSTLTAGSNTTDAASLFALSGFLDFVVLTDNDENPFDLFSFGSDADTPPGTDLPRRGLSFSNLGVTMSYPPQTPLQRTFAFDTDNISFDVTTSTPRTDSLFVNFALALNGLVSGTDDAPPAQSGYLPVVTDARLSGVDGASWYALDYALNLGTPGALAGKIGLTSSLLTAWAPDSTAGDDAQGEIGLKLPGAGGSSKLLSLQSVLKLSIGQLYLTFDRVKSNCFMLLLTEIALQFLGLLKLPPNGSTRFYLFGNPKSSGKPAGLGWYAMYNKDSDDGQRTSAR